MDTDLPTQSLKANWEAFEADLEATAEELESEGWTTVTLHPGDVTTQSGKSEMPPGLDVMVASNEFEALEAELDAGASFSESAVFRRAAGGIMFLVCVMRDPDREVATLFPAFYPQRGESAERLADHARDEGQLQVFVRPLDRSRIVTFTIENPALVFPEASEE